MTNIKNFISTTILGVAIAFSGIPPTMAAPIHIPAPQNTIENSNSVVKIRRHSGHGLRRGVKRGRVHRRGVRRGGFYRGGRYHRGHRYHRHGHRYHRRSRNVLPYIIGGIIIGGVVFHSQAQYRNHIAWCDRRYRSYDVRSDSFQPYHGPRRRCNSPYR